MEKLFDYSDKPVTYYSGPRNEMLQFVPEQVERVLEIGCGTGEFGKTLKLRKNIEVWGVELTQNAAKEARAKLDKVLVGNIEEDNLDLPDNYFDCVIFNDVLEHLVNPWLVLKRVKNTLSDKGYVVASIPNIRYFDIIRQLIDRKEWSYRDSGILDRTHLRFFTINSIKDMFESCGYTIINIQGIHGREFPWKFRVFNLFMKKRYEDMRYLQFACLAKMKARQQ